MFSLTRNKWFFIFVSFIFCTSFHLSIHAQAADKSKIKAIAFDAFPIFDPREIARKAEEVFPGQGQKVMEVWRTRLFEYQWLRALGGQYEDFMSAAEASLVFTSKQLQLNLTEDKKKRFLDSLMNLKTWPDAIAIKELKAMGIELVFLSNMTEAMLANGLKQAGLEKEFTFILSTDAIKTYKPDPKAYALVANKLNLPKESILFVAFASWDVAGAKWYGYPTFWVNRLGANSEELGVSADASGKDLASLVKFVTEYNKNIE